MKTEKLIELLDSLDAKASQLSEKLKQPAISRHESKRVVGTLAKFEEIRNDVLAKLERQNPPTMRVWGKVER